MQIETVTTGFEITLTGLAVHGKPTYEQWVAQGRELWHAKQSIQWCIGDWINYGDHAYGEKYAQAIEETDYRPQTLMNYAYVARAIEPTARREMVSFSSHSEVASIKDTAQRETILDKLEAKEWTRDDVRQWKRDNKQELPKIVLDDSKQSRFTNTVSFRVNTQPLPKQRARTGKFGAYTPQRTRDYETHVGWAAKAAMGQIAPFTGDCSLSITFYREGKRRADLSNMIKAIEDGMNGIAYTDDAQVIEYGYMRVIYEADNPGAEVTVSELKENILTRAA